MESRGKSSKVVENRGKARKVAKNRGKLAKIWGKFAHGKWFTAQGRFAGFTIPGRVRVKFAQNEGHEKATKNAQTLFFFSKQMRATKKPRKVTSKNVTSNGKSSELCS